jgi:glycosyltransferase involved in cell wall biosynthesis
LGDIAVSPKLSTTEANGKLLNYMACGLPCVVFANEINRELLGDCGVYVEKREAESFAFGVEQLLGNSDCRTDLASRSRVLAEQNHSWNARIVKLEKIYNHLLAS